MAAIFLSTRKALGVENSRLTFLEKAPEGWTDLEFGELQNGFYLAQSREDHLYYLHLENTADNIDLLKRASYFYLQSYSPNYDNQIFQIKHDTFVPASLIYLKRHVETAGEIYS
jgi:hypothetical protein